MFEVAHRLFGKNYFPNEKTPGLKSKEQFYTVPDYNAKEIELGYAKIALYNVWFIFLYIYYLYTQAIQYIIDGAIIN